MTWFQTQAKRVTSLLGRLLFVLPLCTLCSVVSATSPQDLLVDGVELLGRTAQASDTVPLRSVFRKAHQSVVITSEHRELVFYEHAARIGELSLIPGVTNLWNWQPDPASTTASLDIFQHDQQHAQVRVFTLHEFDTKKDARLGRFRIGQYPQAARAPNPRVYQNPEGLVQVTKENKSHRVSDHFRLEQFLCKQPGGWPKYVAITRPLLTKLDALVRALQARGVDVATLTVMSGYRTPAYNKAIGNVAYSRHIYGDAADVFVDRDGDGRMDDLDGDGRVTIKDARWLAGVVAALDGSDIAPGGIGTYGSNSAHGPFVHVDTRGKSAQWGPKPIAAN